MSLDSIVSVTITQGTSAVSQAGFGVPLIAGYTAHFEPNEYVRTYDAADGLTALTSDGFAATDPIYMAAQALLAQSPRISQFKVGKLATSSIQNIQLIPVAANSTVYAIDIGGASASITSDATATVAEICTALTTAIDALTVDVDATDNTTSVSIATGAATKCFVYEGYDKNLLKLTDITSANASLATELDAVVLADDDWYCLLLAIQVEADIAAAAAWCETKKKICIVDSADWGITDASTTNDVASDLQDSDYARTALLYHASLGEFGGAAWAGKLLSLDPGSETWAYKNLSGIAVDTLNATQRGAIDAKSANHYLEVAGNNITRKGVTAAGEFIDVTRFIDWIQARIQESVFGALINNNKIPYTDAGVAVVKGLIEGVLRQGIRVGGLSEDPAPTVSAPKVADVAALDKAARSLPDVRFTATLAGAIHELIISGVVSV